MTGIIRASLILTGFLALTLPLMPVQWLLTKIGSPAHRRLPHWYHTQICRLLGVRVHLSGNVSDDLPVLLVSNHVTWLDIPVLSAVAPVSFVAKSEVANWPLAGSLARLQGTVFIDRGRRSAVGATSNELSLRLRAGDHIVLFAEGTSGDGNKVLPFKTSLFAAAKPSRKTSGQNGTNANVGADNTSETGDGATTSLYVQPVALVYAKLHGLPLSRSERSKVAWYGDMEMTTHAWALLKAGPLDVYVHVGTPVPLADFADRKALARYTETKVRHAVVCRQRGRDGDPALIVTRPAKDWSHEAPVVKDRAQTATWV